MGLPATPVVEELGEGLDRIHVESPPALARDESHALLNQLADLAELAPGAAPSSPLAQRLRHLALSSGFTLDPSLLGPHLLLDVDGLPLGTLGARSPRQSPRCEDDGDDLISCALDAIMATPPTPEAAVDPPVMTFDDTFPDLTKKKRIRPAFFVVCCRSSETS
ncbi:hypothetical protein PI124_g18095 [Phytophthora idaei]|nr:hypothetical protein PI125_g18616 [Phytophthora idaei]KAG3137947.1 hypothetical protein PI126_g17140 [Phytophthora idaei]KAG3236899.1 hypothetical protein PI124_g18095 [Phytophthora idaei]